MNFWDYIQDNTVLGVMRHTCNHSTKETEEGGMESLKPAWATQGDTVSKTNQNKKIW
jgi:hypothetical protein